MRVALYARVSTEDQVERFGLPLQRSAFADYVARHGLDDAGPAHHYVDEGYSGSSLERPELDRLRDAVDSIARGGGRPFDAVVIYDEDRLSRKLAHYLLVQEQIESQDLRLLTIHEMPDTEASPERQFVRQIKGAAAELHKAGILDRTRRGRIAKAKAGYFVGSQPPYGYSLDPGRMPGIAVRDDEAAIVREIFETMGLRGGTIGGIATDLTRRGIRPPNAGRRDLAVNGWAESSVGRILQQTAYIGEWFYNRRRSVEPAQHREERYRHRRKTGVKPRPESEWVPVSVPAILERPLWDAAHRQMDWNRRKHERNVTRFYLLRTMARHGCGAPLGGNPSHGIRYYRCPTCRTSVKAEPLEDAVWAEFERLMRNPDMAEQGLRKRSERGALETASTTARLERARRALEANRSAEDQLLDAAIRQMFSVEALEGRAASIRAERERLLVELGEAETAATEARVTDVRLRAIAETCAAIAGQLGTLEPSQRHWALQRFEVQVTWTRDGDDDLVELSGTLLEREPDAGFGEPVAADTLPLSSARRWNVPVRMAA